MNHRTPRSNILVYTLIVFLLVACGSATTAPETTAPTKDLPLNTPTRMLPSATPIPPTPSPIPPSPTVTAVPEGINYLNPQKYLVEYLVKVSNHGFNLTELRVYQPRPIEWDAQTEVEIEEVSPAPSVEGEDTEHGNGMYYWKILGEPKSGQSITFALRFTFTAYETRTNIAPDGIQPYDQSDPQYIMYTRPERFIEVSDQEIIDLADQVAGEETNPNLWPGPSMIMLSIPLNMICAVKD